MRVHSFGVEYRFCQCCLGSVFCASTCDKAEVAQRNLDYIDYDSGRMLTTPCRLPYWARCRPSAAG